MIVLVWAGIPIRWNLSNNASFLLYLLLVRFVAIFVDKNELSLSSCPAFHKVAMK